MSTTNTETLTLYSHPKLYNGCRYKVIQSGIDYDDYLNETSESRLVKTVYYKSLSEPIDIKEDIPVLDSYTYGMLTAMGKKYYIFIDKCDTDQNGKTTISYTIDWWSTEWAKVTPTIGHILRHNQLPQYMAQPFTPYVPDIRIEKLDIKATNKENNGVILFAFINSLRVPDVDYMTYGAMAASTSSMEIVVNGTWQEELGLPDSDVTGVWFVPIIPFSIFQNQWTRSESGGVYYYCGERSEKLSRIFTYTEELNITSTYDKVQGIMDYNGDKIWECPQNKTVNRFRIEVDVAPTNCLLRFIPVSSTSESPVLPMDEISGMGFTYNCRAPSLFIDSGSEFTWRERSYNDEMRRLQMGQDVWASAFSSAENAGFGMAFGGKVGMSAAATGGLVETIGTIGKHLVFDPMIAKAEFSHKLKQQDYMSVVGNSVVRAFKRGINMSVFSSRMDKPSKDRADIDIKVNGYYCDIITDKLYEYITKDTIILAEGVVVEGAVPLDCKHQVVQRFAAGVEFI